MPTNPYKNTDEVKAVIKVRRGPEVDRAQVTYEDGELIYSTDKKRLFVGDGVGDEGTDGGNLVGNRLWISNSFNSASLPYIEKYDLVYRPITTGFYILTGDSIVDPASYLLVGGKELIPQVSTYTIPKASNSTLGGVIVKTGLTVDVNGNLNIDYDSNTLTMVGNKLSVIPGVGGTTGTIGNASYAGYGKVRIVENTGLNIDNGNLSVSIDSRTIKISSVAGADQLYVDSAEIEITNLPKATTTDLGAIIVSDGLKINSSTGELSLKTATDNFIGGVKTGKALSASTSTSELDVIVDGSTIVVNGTNQLEVNYPIASDGDVLTYQSSTTSWIASAAKSGNSGSGCLLFLTPGTYSISDTMIPAGITRVKVHLIGAGGGAWMYDPAGLHPATQTAGGNTSISIEGKTVVAGGGGAGTFTGASYMVGGAGGGVAAVADIIGVASGGTGARWDGTDIASATNGTINMGLQTYGTAVAIGGTGANSIGGACGSGFGYGNQASYNSTSWDIIPPTEFHRYRNSLSFLKIGGSNAGGLDTIFQNTTAYQSAFSNTGFGGGGTANILNTNTVGSGGGGGGYAYIILPIVGGKTYTNCITVGQGGSTNWLKNNYNTGQPGAVFIEW